MLAAPSSRSASDRVAHVGVEVLPGRDPRWQRRIPARDPQRLEQRHPGPRARGVGGHEYVGQLVPRTLKGLPIREEALKGLVPGGERRGRQIGEEQVLDGAGPSGRVSGDRDAGRQPNGDPGPGIDPPGGTPPRRLPVEQLRRARPGGGERAEQAIEGQQARQMA